MMLFKIVDEFDQATGKKIREKKVFDCMICDFTGERVDEGFGNPVIYEIDYNDSDPCFGDHIAERWFYDWNEKYGEKDLDPEDEDGEIDAYDIFGQTRYIFKTDDDGTEPFADLLKAAKKAKFEIISLDHLLRWSRGRMLEKLFHEGKYKPEQFIN
jgi:hypothetical protein